MHAWIVVTSRVSQWTFPLVAAAALVGGCGPQMVTVFPHDSTGHQVCPHALGIVSKPWSTGAKLPEVEGPRYRGRIVPPAAAPSLLCQCSRETLGPPDGYWTPTLTDIAELENGLPDYLRDHPRYALPQRWSDLTLYGRLYLGVVRSGARAIYVDLRLAPTDLKEWDKTTFDEGICDGGPTFWSVEYDVDHHRFTMVSHNGNA